MVQEIRDISLVKSRVSFSNSLMSGNFIQTFHKNHNKNSNIIPENFFLLVLIKLKIFLKIWFLTVIGLLNYPSDSSVISRV